MSTEKQIFLSKCVGIAKQRGKLNNATEILGLVTPCYVYTDELVHMCISTDLKYIDIERRKNRNIVVLVQHGRVLRFDAEYVIIEDAINTLCTGLEIDLRAMIHLQEEQPVAYMD